MFESNFPVDKAMYSYTVGWNAFKRISARASEAEKTNLFSGAASRFYRISPTGQEVSRLAKSPPGINH
jgi:predicted TIM-barrel fold metal-dependent hydrolase